MSFKIHFVQAYNYLVKKISGSAAAGDALSKRRKQRARNLNKKPQEHQPSIIGDTVTISDKARALQEKTRTR
jgi:hypothetical protein